MDPLPDEEEERVTVQKTEAELLKAQMVKTIRSLVRVKHSLRADEELNEVLPKAEQAFDIALQRGELPDPADIVIRYFADGGAG